jgi:anti-sigma B factor antagonist
VDEDSYTDATHLLSEEGGLVADQGAGKLPQSQRLSDIDATGLLSVVVQELDHTVSIVHVAGEVDMATGPLLQARVHEVLAKRPELLIIDLSKVSFMGSTALSVLIGARHVAIQQNTSVQLRGIDRRAVAIPLQITGVAQLFGVVPPRPAAGRE